MTNAKHSTATPSDGAAKTPRWGMVIDVNRCVGCQTCTIACKHANDTIPGVQWRKVLDVETGTFPDVTRQFLVVGCQHCAEPSCVPVCPTGATKQRADGLVTMDYDICIGCGYCAVSCPYQARTIAHDQHWYYGEETAQEKAVEHRDRLGVAQKCTFCQDRIDDGLARGLTPGRDPEATPACSSACISQAIQFGDFNDPDSAVSRLTKDSPFFQMHAELGNDPQIKYLYTTPAVPGRAADERDLADDRLADPANPLVGQVQKFWDWRAALNWCFGGVSAGFIVVSTLLMLLGGSAQSLQPVLNIFGGALMATGLFFVWLKIGRKFRAWRAIFRPQSSWMTRELYVAAVLYPAGLAAFLWPSKPLLALVGLLALGFLWCQAKILFMAKGIPVWRVPLIPWMILATGLLEGFGLLLLVRALDSAHIAPGTEWPLLLFPLVVVNAVLWTAYRGTAKARGIPPLARRVLRRVTWPLHAIGHGLPVAILALGMMAPVVADGAFALAGLCALAGGVFWKFMVIVRASYQQGYAMPMMAHRGSGTRAAPPRTQGAPSLRKEPMTRVGATRG